MQLTTPQLYALAVMAGLIVALIGISYVSGLRTGRKAGLEFGSATAANHWSKLLQDKSRARDDAAAELARCSRRLTATQLRLEELAGYPTPLTALDVEMLQESMKLLKLTNPLLEGIKCDSLYRTGTAIQKHIHGLIQRINQAHERDRNHPDLALLDWLEEHATVDFDLETATLRFDCRPGTEAGVESVRALISQAKAESDQGAVA